MLLLATLFVLQTAVAAPSPAPVTIPMPEGSRAPDLAVADDGTIVLACATKRELHVAVSRDRGKTFSAAVLAGSAPDIAVGMRRGPKVALHGDDVCVTAVCGELGGGKDGDVLAFVSRDRGATWAAPARVHASRSTAREGLHALASAPNGDLCCVWIDLREEAPAVFGATSKDAGRTWSDGVRFAQPEGAALCPCCAPSVAFDGKGALYVTWRAQFGATRDLVLATARDGLATPPAAAKRIGTSAWKLDACPMDGGAIRAAGDDVVVAWRCDTKVLATTDRTVEREFSVGSGLQPFVAVGKDAHVVWSEKNGGRLLERALGRGLEGPPERELASAASYAVAAASPTRGAGPVVVAYERLQGGTTRIEFVVLEP
ncbi:MAG: exo-alpha-sialidase [Planctomycetes bacterium]|nr:exo-alpha-sialidase [Planctomycetota bacterium]